jgi:hypothetical protein
MNAIAIVYVYVSVAIGATMATIATERLMRKVPDWYDGAEGIAMAIYATGMWAAHSIAWPIIIPAMINSRRKASDDRVRD